MAAVDVQVLLSDLEAQAEAERTKLREEARQKTEEIRQRAEAEVSRVEQEAVRRMERQVALDAERINGRFRIEERRRRLAARRAGLARAFALARERLDQRLSTGSYRAVLTRLVREALEAVGGEVDLEVARQDAGAAREILAALGAAGTVRERGDEPGTVVAVSRDGVRRADNSLRARLLQAERLLEEGVARELSGGSP